MNALSKGAAISRYSLPLISRTSWAEQRCQRSQSNHFASLKCSAYWRASTLLEALMRWKIEASRMAGHVSWHQAGFLMRNIRSA